MAGGGTSGDSVRASASDTGVCSWSGCAAATRVVEYDSDDDVYLLVCENEHKTWITIDDETWK